MHHTSGDALPFDKPLDETRRDFAITTGRRHGILPHIGVAGVEAEAQVIEANAFDCSTPARMTPCWIAANALFGGKSDRYVPSTSRHASPR